jgi:SRSO17 transposase
MINQLHEGYEIHFISKTRNMIKQSYQYIQGKFLTTGNGNMTTYQKKVPDCNSQSLQHFISNSPWKHQPVLDHIQRDVVEAIGDSEHGSIHVDECCLPKQGKYSVGAARQYCGRLGKIANCQVGVFLGYTNDSFRTLIDERLYLPQDWIKDKERRKKCGIPWHIRFKKKTQLAWEMIQHAQKQHIPFGWIGMDCLYGRDSWLRNQIDQHDMIFIADIPHNLRVWLQKPTVGIPQRKEGRGRPPSRKQVLDGESFRVDELKERVADSEWNHLFIRDSERCELWADMLFLRVYPCEENGLPGKECWLIISRNSENKRVTYQYSNAPKQTSKDQLAKMSGSRYWIERTFQDGTGIAGLKDHQVRSWTGWHHHMTMTMLAMLYLMLLTIKLGRKADFLTVQDAKEILEVVMPKRDISQEEFVQMLFEKQKKRVSARQSHHRHHQ